MWLIYLLFIIFSYFAFTCDFTADVFLSNSCFNYYVGRYIFIPFYCACLLGKSYINVQKIKLWKHVIWALQIPSGCAFHFSTNTHFMLYITR